DPSGFLFNYSHLCGSTQRAATGGPPPLKQQKLNFSAKPVSERELKQLIGQYVVEEIMQLNTVDSPAFLFLAYLDKEYAEMERNLKASLNEVDFVSTTVDIWTANANNRSYMGVTLHWIHRSTLERNKAALACKRIRGRHTYDVIGAEIENIHSSHGLLNKVVATVTDIGSNFMKAFKVFQPVTEFNDETEEESTKTDDDDVTFLNLTEILSAENEGNGQLSLPPHHICASHKSKAVYRSSIAKCTMLWTKSSRSTLASEAVEEVSKRKLLVPTSTRWSSFFDAVKRVAEIPMSDLNTLCSKLGVQCFIDQEYQFLYEYCTIMKPLTAALDILQGDCPYGTLLPTLEVLMQKTMAVKDSLSRMTAGLPDAIRYIP
uniref:HAT C-terminal dimerisation domain-containing protein n=1 Tax=Kryptolebias marmoratus TaxID=37003 RepID=A0A3Q3AK76_KRYMA